MTVDLESDCTPQDLLLAAADDIYMNGLAKGEFQKPDGSCCVLGAITGGYYAGPSKNEYQAVALIRNHLKSIYVTDWYSLTSWNDHPRSTKDSVIRALHDAARTIHND